MGRDRLRQVALGCLLHDIGKLIGPVGAGKDGTAVLQGRAQIQKAAREAGYHLLAASAPSRERQPQRLGGTTRSNGSGYPRQWSKQHGLPATAVRDGPSRISLLAEIAAVADVFDSLSSPQFTARPSHRVVVRPARRGGTPPQPGDRAKLPRLAPHYGWARDDRHQLAHAGAAALSPRSTCATWPTPSCACSKTRRAGPYSRYGGPAAAPETRISTVLGSTPAPRPGPASRQGRCRCSEAPPRRQPLLLPPASAPREATAAALSRVRKNRMSPIR